MPNNSLVAWVGRTDLKAAAGEREAGLGPIAQGVQAGKYDAIYLLSDFSAVESKAYIKWLTSRTDAVIHLRAVKLTSPINFGEIYERVVEVLCCLRGLDYPVCASLTTQRGIAYFLCGATYCSGMGWVFVIAQYG